MDLTTLPLAMLTTASLVLAVVHVCLSFLMEDWIQRENNRLASHRERVRTARLVLAKTERELSRATNGLSDLQDLLNEIERGFATQMMASARQRDLMAAFAGQSNVVVPRAFAGDGLTVVPSRRGPVLTRKLVG